MCCEKEGPKRGVLAEMQRKKRRKSVTDRRVALLRQVSIFQEMSEEDLGRAAFRFDEIKYMPGDVVIRQGDIGDEFFIVHSGSADVLLVEDSGEEKLLAKISRNAFFGEMALMTDEPRSATIRADPQSIAPLVLLRMRRFEFEELFAGKENVIEEWNPNLKERRAWEILASMPMFSQSNDTELRYMVKRLKLERFQPNSYISQQGREGKSFYIILEGIVKITKNDICALNGERPLLELCEDDYFGEVGLLSANHARSANAIAITTVLCYALDREVFIQCQNEAMEKELRKKAYFKQLDQLGKFTSSKTILQGLVSTAQVEDDHEAGDCAHNNQQDETLQRRPLSSSTLASSTHEEKEDDRAFTLGDVLRAKARKILQCLHATLATRMYQKLCREPCKSTAAEMYGSLVGRAFGMCAHRYAFHCRIQTILAQLRQKSSAERNTAEIAMVAALLLQSVDFSKNFLQGWSQLHVAQFCHHVHIHFIKQGETLFDPSDQAQRVFCVIRGATTLYNPKNTYNRTYQKQKNTKKDTEIFAAIAEPGAAVGVEALDEPLDAPRKNYAHRAVALTDVITLAIRHDDFAHIARHARAGTVSDVHHKFALVKQVHLFRHISAEQQYSLAYALSPLNIPRGKMVLKPGETSPHLFIIENGRALIHIPTSSNPRIKRSRAQEDHRQSASAGINITALERGAIFGDSGILTNHPDLLPSAPITESAMVIAETQLSLFILKPDHYALLDSSVLQLLEEDRSLRALRQREHRQRQKRLLS